MHAETTATIKLQCINFLSFLAAIAAAANLSFCLMMILYTFAISTQNGTQPMATDHRMLHRPLVLRPVARPAVLLIFKGGILGKQ